MGDLLPVLLESANLVSVENLLSFQKESLWQKILNLFEFDVDARSEPFSVDKANNNKCFIRRK